MDEKDFKKMNEIIDLYMDSEHPINEIISAMKDNLWYEFMDDDNENLSTLPEGNSDKSEETNRNLQVTPMASPKEATLPSVNSNIKLNKVIHL